MSAVAEAVSVYNTAAGSKAQDLKAGGIKNVGSNLLKSLHKQDKIRLKSASSNIIEKYKALCLNRKKKAKNEK